MKHISKYPDSQHTEWIWVCSRSTYLILRPKHEVVNDQLLATIEEVCKSDGAVGTSEGVLLVDFDHGEVLELRVQLIIGAHSGLFFDKEGFAGCDPFGWGYDLREDVLVL
jgi:hypothetical protein